jgi:SAM-dependent methyltransferase
MEPAPPRSRHTLSQRPTHHALPLFRRLLPRPVKSGIKALLDRYPRWVCGQEFYSQTLTRLNERPIEISFVFKAVRDLYPRTILDVGTGTTALPHLLRNCGMIVTAIDNVRDYWRDGMVNRHYYIVDDDITNTRLQGGFDLIICVSVLEHIERADDAVKNMFSLLNRDGHLLLTFPYNEKMYVRNVYELPGSTYGKGSPYITQAFSRTQLDSWVQNYHGTIVEQEYWQCWDGEHWTVGNQVIPPRRAFSENPHQLSCVLIQRRE